MLLEKLKEFATKSSIHGISHINDERMWIAKIFWMVVTGAEFIIAISMFLAKNESWNKNPTITTMESMTVPITEIQFPTVTLCQLPPRVDNFGVVEKVVNLLTLSGRSEVPKSGSQAFSLDTELNFLTSFLFDVFNKHELQPKELDHESDLDKQIQQRLQNLITQGKASIQDLEMEVKSNVLGKILDMHSVLSHLEFKFNATLYKNPDVAQSAEVEHFYGVLRTLNPNLFVPAGTLATHLAPALGKSMRKPSILSSFQQALPDLKDYIPFGECDRNFSSTCDEELILHQFSAGFTKTLGLQRNLEDTVSLFDVPYLVSLIDNKQSTKRHMADFTRNSNPSHFSKDSESSLSTCTAMFDDIVSRGSSLQEQCSQSGDHQECCNWITTPMLTPDLSKIMTVMKFASHLTKINSSLIEDWRPLLTESSGLDLTGLESLREFTPNIPICTFSNLRVPTSYQYCELFRPTISSEGICQSFNAKPFNETLLDSAFTRAFVQAFGGDEIQGSGGQLTEMRADYFMFYLDKHTFLKSEWVDADDSYQSHFFLGLSDQYNFFDFYKKFTNIRTGYVTMIKVKAKQLRASEHLKSMSIDDRKCRFHDETDGMQMFKFYSHSSCMLECKLKHARKLCACTPWNYPFLPSQEVAVCDQFGFYCFDSVMNDKKVADGCQCQSDCHILEFEFTEKEWPIDLSEVCRSNRALKEYVGRERELELLSLMNQTFDLLFGRTDMIYEEMQQDLEIFCREKVTADMSIVIVQMDSPTFERSVKSIRMELDDKIAFIGGTLGLFTGMSFVSFVEIFYWMAKALVQFLIQLYKQKKYCIRKSAISTRKSPEGT